jgi:hypothetical protein
MKRLRDQFRNTTRTIKRTSGKCRVHLHMRMATRRSRLRKANSNRGRSVSSRSRILIVRFQFLPITTSLSFHGTESPYVEFQASGFSVEWIACARGTL